MIKITRSHIRNNLDTLFVFGDNVRREGYGGQAKEARGEPNSFGIAVKWAPDNWPGSYFEDGTAAHAVVALDLVRLKEKTRQYDKLYVIPGIGTGLARLTEKAPELFKFLCEELTKLEEQVTDD